MDGRTEKVCLGQGRERQVYSTNSHRLKVVIRSQEDLPEQVMFLLKYGKSKVRIIANPTTIKPVYIRSVRSCVCVRIPKGAYVSMGL